MKNIKKTEYFSWKIGELPKGCQLCVKGLKSVLFLTGLCNKKCIFCPISDRKKGKDVIYINERPVTNDNDLIEEVKLCSSKGVGITGGNPLLKLDRTINYIKLLKKEFGNDFHIHLYTTLDLVNEKNLEQLYNSGLDEIRFHPEIYKELDKEIKKIELALKFDWDVGVEIPVIPKQEKNIKKLIDYIDKKVKFINLNELEYTEELSDFGFVCKNYNSYAIGGSEKLALQILKYSMDKSLDVHYCTVKLKDWVQLKNRLINRAKNIKKWYDNMSSDGMLIRGAVYLDKGNKLKEINKLIDFSERYKSKFELDEKKFRLLTSVDIVKKLEKEIKENNLFPAIVEEYPTYDGMEVEVEFL